MMPARPFEVGDTAVLAPSMPGYGYAGSEDVTPKRVTVIRVHGRYVTVTGGARFDTWTQVAVASDTSRNREAADRRTVWVIAYRPKDGPSGAPPYSVLYQADDWDRLAHAIHRARVRARFIASPVPGSVVAAVCELVDRTDDPARPPVDDLLAQIVAAVRRMDARYRADVIEAFR